MDGGFNVPAERLTNPGTEKKLTAFSQRVQGAESGKGDPGDPAASGVADVVSSLTGQASIRNGVLSTYRLTFAMPGATADLNGTYSFHGGAVHLGGNLKMDSDISHATTGFKSVLLKPLAPFFKRKKAGAVIPVAVTGVPHQYKVSQNLLHTGRRELERLSDSREDIPFGDAASVSFIDCSLQQRELRFEFRLAGQTNFALRHFCMCIRHSLTISLAAKDCQGGFSKGR
jgi:hypothetical protein